MRKSWAQEANFFHSQSNWPKSLNRTGSKFSNNIFVEFYAKIFRKILRSEKNDVF